MSSSIGADGTERERLGLTANLGRHYESFDATSAERGELEDLALHAFGPSKSKLDFLGGAWSEEFSYDEAGNRESVRTAFGTVGFSYNDANGNLVYCGT